MYLCHRGHNGRETGRRGDRATGENEFSNFKLKRRNGKIAWSPCLPVAPARCPGVMSEVKRDRSNIRREPHVEREAGGDRARRLRARFARNQGGRAVRRDPRRTRRRASVRSGGL